MSSFPPPSLPLERHVVFVASTTGQGDPPQQMLPLWKVLLKRTLPGDALSGVRAAVFGLGDSGYAKYNVAAKKLYRRLAQLGASELAPLGLGDDQHPKGYDYALEAFLPPLWQALSAVQAPEPVDAGEPDPPRFRVEPTGARRRQPAHVAGAVDELASARAAFEALNDASFGAALPLTGQPAQAGVPRPHAGRPFLARVAANRRLTSEEHWQDVRHVVLDTAVDARGEERSGWGENAISYTAGDVACVLPRVDDEAIRFCASRLGLHPDDVVSVGRPEGGEGAFEARVGALLGGVLDMLSVPPRRYFFEVLARLTASEMEAERLRELSSPEGLDELHQYCTRERRSALEVLQDFPHARLPLEWALQLVPR